MKRYLTMLLALVHFFGHAQSPPLKEAEATLEKALVEKDTVALKRLLHDGLTYGHSNGWTQTKADVLKDVAGGKLTYDKIESTETTWTVAGDVATVRSTADIGYSLDGKPGTLHLHVLQVRVKTGEGWQLLARQGVKL